MPVKKIEPGPAIFTMAGIPVQVTRKDVKNINLRVYPGTGTVKLSHPRHISRKVVEEFVKSRAEWIENQLEKKKRENPFRKPKEFISGEEHYVWGEARILQVYAVNGKSRVSADSNANLLMAVRPGSTKEKRCRILNEWYREELKERIRKLINKWEPVMGVTVADFGVKNMKTRWGSCNTRAKRIWLNLELAKRDPACLEFVVVHEMVHLLERLHSKKFYRYMDRFLPDWRKTDRLLR